MGYYLKVTIIFRGGIRNNNYPNPPPSIVMVAYLDSEFTEITISHRFSILGTASN